MKTYLITAFDFQGKVLGSLLVTCPEYMLYGYIDGYCEQFHLCRSYTVKEIILDDEQV